MHCRSSQQLHHSPFSLDMLIELCKYNKMFLGSLLGDFIGFFPNGINYSILKYREIAWCFSRVFLIDLAVVYSKSFRDITWDLSWISLPYST